MNEEPKNHNESIISFFDHELRWWTDVYREDLPMGFFSHEMRCRLELVTTQLRAQILSRECPDVLECGCGPGDILQQLAPLPCRLTGLDLNPRYLELAAAKAPGASLHVGNVEQLPFADESFDIVYAVGVLQYLDHDRQAAAEICRVTKPGGCVLISVPNYWMLHLILDPFYLYRACARLFGAKEAETGAEFDSSKIRRYTRGEFRRLFAGSAMRETHASCSSFGPMRVWRKDCLPIAASMRLSDSLRRLSDLKAGAFLRRLGNHWVITLRKEGRTVNGRSDS